jgi:pathogenesis-related protein 1
VETASSRVEPAKMQGMLEAHNRVRTSLGLAPLVWSGKLAGYAQRWAQHLAVNNGCTMQHRSHAHANEWDVGENLYWASPLKWSDGREEVQTVNAADVADSWASERQDYNYSANSCRLGKQCGHYTQMVWRSTQQVGCGMAICPNQAQLWVCNYDPVGNWVGERPY